MLSMLKVSKVILTFDTSDMLQHTMLYMCQRLFQPSTPPTCFNIHKLWVKTCVCSFDTFHMHRYYSPQLFWATFDTFDIQSITALIVHIELLLTPSTWVTLLCIEGPVCTFDTSDIHSLLILYWYYSSVSHLRHLRHAFWSFAHSAVFGTFETSDIKESFDLQWRF